MSDLTLPQQTEKTASAARYSRDRRSFGSLLSRHGLIVFFFLLIAVGAFASPVFLDPRNIGNVLTIAAPLGIVAMGQALVLLVRGLDLSVASIMATMAVIATQFNSTDDAMIPVIFATCLILAAVIGFVNGWLVTKRHVTPFLATLATMIVLQGVRFVITKGAPSGAVPPGFRFLGTGNILGIPVGFIATIALGLLLWRLTLHSRFGRELYLVGDNPKGARLVGINSDAVTIAAYVLCALCACLGGLFLTGYTGSIDNFVGRGYELQSIVAAVMGGVALTGGKGTVFGALIGAMILAIVFNLLLLIGYTIEVQYIIQGLIIIIASAFYMLRERTYS